MYSNGFPRCTRVSSSSWTFHSSHSRCSSPWLFTLTSLPHPLLDVGIKDPTIPLLTFFPRLCSTLQIHTHPSLPATFCSLSPSILLPSSFILFHPPPLPPTTLLSPLHNHPHYQQCPSTKLVTKSMRSTRCTTSIPMAPTWPPSK